MIAAIVVGGHLALAIRGAPELAAPDHQRVLEQPAALEIHHQRGGWLISLLALARDAARQSAVLIPTLMKELYEANAAFDEAARE